MESAQENYQLARGRFDAGVANIIELTDAQLALTQAQSDQAQALSDYRIAIAPAGAGRRPALGIPLPAPASPYHEARILWVG